MVVDLQRVSRVQPAPHELEQLLSSSKTDASVDAENAFWAPRYLHLLATLRPSVHHTALRECLVRTTRVLQPEDCAALHETILQNREHWTTYAEQGLHRLGKATCTLAHLKPGVVPQQRELMLGLFGDLYDQLLGVLKQVLDTERVSLEEDTFLPCFLISRPDDFIPSSIARTIHNLLPKSSVLHTDEMPHLLGRHESTPPPNISFILPIALPTAPTGLLLFDRVGAARHSPLSAVLSRYARVPYTVGQLVLFEGDRWHAPWPPSTVRPNESRILLVGHAVRRESEWRVFY